MFKDGGGFLGRWTLKSALFQEWSDGLSRFWACRYKFKEVKKSFNNFWVGVVKNGHGFLCHRVLKSALSQEYMDELSWFFACWNKFRKAKSNFIDFWVGMVKIGCSLLGGMILICWIARMSGWVGLILSIADSNLGKLKVDNLWMRVDKNGCGL